MTRTHNPTAEWMAKDIGLLARYLGDRCGIEIVNFGLCNAEGNPLEPGKVSRDQAKDYHYLSTRYLEHNAHIPKAVRREVHSLNGKLKKYGYAGEPEAPLFSVGEGEPLQQGVKTLVIDIAPLLNQPQLIDDLREGMNRKAENTVSRREFGRHVKHLAGKTANWAVTVGGLAGMTDGVENIRNRPGIPLYIPIMELILGGTMASIGLKNNIRLDQKREDQQRFKPDQDNVREISHLLLLGSLEQQLAAWLAAQRPRGGEGRSR